MNGKVIALSFVLLDFAALSAYAVYQYGYLGVIQRMLADSATTLAFVDLTIALSLVVAWMWQDARARGTSVLPYILLTLAFGSVGPLLYLIRREAAVTRAPMRAAAGVRA
jgi:uncharacterized protein DUF2834